MPATRSSSRLSAVQTTTIISEEAVPSGGVKRKATTTTASTTVEKKAKKSRTSTKAKIAPTEPSAEASPPTPQQAPSGLDSGEQAQGFGVEDTPVPAVLSFDFEEAKQHLTSVDSRFEDLFEKMPCRPFEHLEQVHPFR